MYSREKDRPFLKISVVLPNMVTQARTVLERGFVVPGLSSSPQSLMTFESNVLFVLRFMVDCKAPDPPTTRRTTAMPDPTLPADHAADKKRTSSGPRPTLPPPPPQPPSLPLPPGGRRHLAVTAAGLLELLRKAGVHLPGGDKTLNPKP